MIQFTKDKPIQQRLEKKPMLQLRGSTILKKLRRFLPFLVLSFPGILFVFVFSYVPLYGILIAFKDFNVVKGILGSPWSGLKNFEFFVRSGALVRIVPNTLFLNILFILFSTIFALLIALTLNEIRLRFFKRITQSLMFLPYFVSWIVVSMMVQSFLYGDHALVNQMVSTLGLSPINWYHEPKPWPVMLTIFQVWKNAGYASVIYLAVITGISEEIYEAGRIDGASNAQLAFLITLPLLIPTMSIMTLLAVGNIFRGDFGMIYALVGDNSLLYPTTDVIDTYVFRAMRTLGDFGMAAAVGLIQSVAGFIMVIIANWLSKKYTEGGSLF